MLEQEGVDIIQTEGGKCSKPSQSGVLGLIEKVIACNLGSINCAISHCLKQMDLMMVLVI
jgi:hypothetical protein